MKKKVLVAMSGGVDSSTAAFLLKEQGYSVVGVTMCLGVESVNENKPTCCGTQAIADARRVADTLEIPHYVFDYSDQLASRVIAPFVNQYSQGRTPNPCVLCNRYLKFESLLKKADAMGFEFLATGHYAALRPTDSGPGMYRAIDKRKDQTYFLYHIDRTYLERILFPLSELDKSQVRDAASRAGLAVAHKPGSQDICFIPDGDYRNFVAERLGPAQPGDFVDISGKRLGTHNGLINYTVGQRKGLGIAAANPLYVLRLDTGANQVILGDESQLYATRLYAGDVNLLVDELPPRALAQVRYNHPPAPCTVEKMATGFSVLFDSPEKSITPGQSVVLYDNDRVLGGGIID